MPNILLIQPSIPNYRIDLFNRISSKRTQDTFSVLATNKDHTNVLSNTNGANFIYILNGKIRNVLFLHWQPGIWKHISLLKTGDKLVILGNPYFLLTMAYAYIIKRRGVEVIWWGQLWSEKTTKLSLKVKLLIIKLLPTKVLLYTRREYIFLKRLGIKKPAFYLNNGINNQNIIKYRKPYNSFDRGNRILFLGRLTPKSNFQLLLDSLIQCSNVQLDVVGGDLDSSLFYNFIKKHNLHSRVKFHGMIIDEAKIATIANKCLFFVYPGSVGLSLIHAFNYGLPALVHDKRRKHMPEIIAFKKGYNGETFSHSDVNSLAKTIQHLLHNKNYLNTLSKGAIKTSASDYNTEIMADRFIECIDN